MIHSTVCTQANVVLVACILHMMGVDPNRELIEHVNHELLTFNEWCGGYLNK